MPADGTVLDVGCGGGAGAYALVPPAGRVMGIDENHGMLAAFAAEGDGRDVEHAEVLGSWLDVAAEVGAADVVVCHHVAYNVAPLGPFLLALTAHARNRVVLELTAVHPQVALAPLWRHFWNLERPAGPTADDAIAVALEVGLEPQRERWARDVRWRPSDVNRADVVAWVRRRLCLTSDRDGDVAAALGDDAGRPADVIMLWWPGAAGQASGSSNGRAL